MVLLDKHAANDIHVQLMFGRPKVDNFRYPNSAPVPAMQTPSLPPDEEARIATLRDLVILDTDAEEKFDMLTAYACSQFGVPIALISLVDTNRQWFKSRCGLEATETGRDISFCGHAILQDDILEIRDATADGRFSDNPLVTGEPHIRFYAGCPLTMANGQKIGTFCLIDSKPRSLDEWEAQHLRDLAHVAALEIQGLDAAEARLKVGACDALEWERASCPHRLLPRRA